ncbi:MAG: TetR/AcrR family transcriptional regulator [Cytophagales bacterium]|nr:TetR/AcrR family transcriptional regulator [Armatimonadota bacterium]
MTKEQRREQLLNTAHEIIRSEGTDALTLAHVAEKAGVSKPIAYEHFGSRDGLLIALYRDYDERQTRAMRDALKASGKTMEDVVSILGATYVDCAVSCGPEYGAIAAALSATEEMEGLLQSCRDSFAGECQEAIAPFVTLPGQESRVILVGVLGAAEALSQAAAAGRLSRAEAVAALSRVMIGAFRQSAA